MTRRDLSKACLWKHFNLKEAVSNWIKQDLAKIKQAGQRKELWQPVFEAASALYAQTRSCIRARQATDAEKIAAAAVLLFDTTATLPKDRVMRWAGLRGQRLVTILDTGQTKALLPVSKNATLAPNRVLFLPSFSGTCFVA